MMVFLCFFKFLILLLLYLSVIPLGLNFFILSFIALEIIEASLVVYVSISLLDKFLLLGTIDSPSNKLSFMHMALTCCLNLFQSTLSNIKAPSLIELSTDKHSLSMHISIDNASWSLSKGRLIKLPE